MVTKLYVHRFRGIREGMLEDLGKFNLLIGPNNSGKTAILEMLYLGGLSGRHCNLILEGTRSESDVLEVTTTTAQDFLGYEPLSRLRQRHGQKERWEGSPASLNQEGGLEIALRDMPENFSMYHFRLGIPLDEPKFLEDDLKKIALFSIRGKSENPISVPSDLIPRLFEKQGIRPEDSTWNILWQPEWVYKWGRSDKGIDQLAMWAETGRFSEYSHVLFFDFHASNSHFKDQFARMAFRIPDWPEKIAESLGHVFPSLKDATIKIFDAPDGQDGKTGYISFKGEEPLAVDHFGDGTRHSFKVLASLIALADMVDEKRPGLFLWEDPELFMHPEALMLMLNEIMRLVQDKPIQVFLSTQSLETVMLLTHHFRGSSPEMQSEFRVIRMKLDGGRTYAATYYYEYILAWLEQGRDPRSWRKANLPFYYRFKSLNNCPEEDLQ